MIQRESSRGVLNPTAMPAKFQLTRHAPAPDLAFFVQHYWVVSWDLRGQAAYQSETLPYPRVNLVVEPGKAQVYGVIRRRYVTLLTGAGSAFGLNFRPGGFRGILKAPLHTITDAALDLDTVFGPDGPALAAVIAATDDTAARICRAEQFLRAWQPAPDPHAALVDIIVEAVIADPAIRRASDIAERFGLSQRTLQRLFREYVGVGPKWLIQRFRLQEAAELLASDAAPPWPVLAAELGYFDQAHFINDFKAVIGKTPAAYHQELSDHRAAGLTSI